MEFFYRIYLQVHTHQFWPALLGWCNYMQKIIPERRAFSSEISVVKNIPRSRDEIMLKCNLNGISYNTPFRLSEISFLLIQSTSYFAYNY